MRLNSFRQLKMTDSGQLFVPPLIVFEQQPAGYLVHELFCHLMEADLFKLVYKRLLSNTIFQGINIFDDATRYRPYFDMGGYDDCGNAVQFTTLIDHGQIQSFLSVTPGLCVGDLHSNGGNGRCENGSFDVLARMNFISTVVDDSFHVDDTYFNRLDFLKVVTAYSGNVNPITFEFTLHCACVLVLHGTDTMYCPNIQLRGNVLDLAQSILLATGSVASGLATCQKGNQSVLVGWSSPCLVLSTCCLRIT